MILLVTATTAAGSASIWKTPKIIGMNTVAVLIATIINPMGLKKKLIAAIENPTKIIFIPSSNIIQPPFYFERPTTPYRPITRISPSILLYLIQINACNHYQVTI